jgi:hypothetical protein
MEVAEVFCYAAETILRTLREVSFLFQIVAAVLSVRIVGSISEFYPMSVQMLKSSHDLRFSLCSPPLLRVTFDSPHSKPASLHGNPAGPKEKLPRTTLLAA